MKLPLSNVERTSRPRLAAFSFEIVINTEKAGFLAVGCARRLLRQDVAATTIKGGVRKGHSFCFRRAIGVCNPVVPGAVSLFTCFVPGPNVKLAYLTEVATFLAAHGHLFIQQSGEVSTATVGDYYVLSRNRLNRWMRELNDIEHGVCEGDPMHLAEIVADRPTVRAVTGQILINEMVSRIWTVLLLARDASNGIDRIRPVARNLYLGHLAVRHKAMGVVLADVHLSPGDFMAIEQLRRSTERWTDVLCCPFMGQYNLWDFAFDKSRAQEFLRDRTEPPVRSHRSRTWVLILAGLRHSFRELLELNVPMHNEDRKIVRLMLNSFPEDAPEMAFWTNSRVREPGKC